jgi:microcystin-dependent protein
MPDFAVNGLTFQNYSNTTEDAIAPISCDFGSYSKYSITPTGNNGVAAPIQVANGVVIDNVLNTYVVTVTIGTFVETIPAYTKSLLKIPNNGPVLVVQAAGPQIVPLYFFTGTFPGSQFATNYLAVQTTAALAVRTGIVEFFAGQPVNIPVNTLLADGSAVSRATYSGLFGKIGTIWGPGDGSTTFNLPNANARMLVGAGAASGLSTRSVGATGGLESVALVAANNGPHTHTVTDPGHTHTVTDPGHIHSMQNTQIWDANSGASAMGATGTSGFGVKSTNSSTTGITVASGTTGISIVSQGTGTAHENMPPYAAMTAIIWT